MDTPLAPYFAETLTSEDLDEMNIEILRNTLYKVCIVTQHLVGFCYPLPDAHTAQVKGDAVLHAGCKRVANTEP